jgi:hypothetical protein
MKSGHPVLPFYTQGGIPSVSFLSLFPMTQVQASVCAILRETQYLYTAAVSEFAPPTQVGMARYPEPGLHLEPKKENRPLRRLIGLDQHLDVIGFPFVRFGRQRGENPLTFRARKQDLEHDWSLDESGEHPQRVTRERLRFLFSHVSFSPKRAAGTRKKTGACTST